MPDIMVSVRAAHCILVIIEFLLLLLVWQLYYHFYFVFIYLFYAVHLSEALSYILVLEFYM